MESSKNILLVKTTLKCSLLATNVKKISMEKDQQASGSGDVVGLNSLPLSFPQETTP